MKLLVRAFQWLQYYMSSLNIGRPELSNNDIELLKNLNLCVERYPVPRLYIDTDKLIDHLGIPYVDKNHYHQIALNSEDGLKELEEYYSKFQPKQLSEIFLNNSDSNLKNINDYPSWYFANRMPWSTKQRVSRCGDIHKDINAHFGPVNSVFAQSEWLRLKRASQSIVKNGYKPWLFPDGFIRGFIVCSKNKYVFIVTSGKHRAASLCNKYKKIRVRFDWDDYIPIVSKEKTDDLPQVASGLYTKEETQALINRYVSLVE